MQLCSNNFIINQYLFSIRLIFPDKGNRQAFTDFTGKIIGDFTMTGNSFNAAALRIDPQRMRTTFAFQETAILSEMSQ